MKKLLLMSSLIASTAAMAQLPDGSICPDFTGTDLNGVTHNLYDYLDQGYTVVVDVSATWCGPCWNYHNTGALEDLYTTYGPGTAADKVMVLFIEGDGSTTMADLQGNTGATQGDWITGTPYPIIDNASIANLLEITYFPTIYTICPSRKIVESSQISTAAHWAIANAGDCQAAVAGTNLAVASYNGSLSACGNLDMPVTIMNMGTNPITSATIAVKQGNTTLATQNWTSNLSTYDTDDITFANVAVTDAAAVTVNITTTDAQSSDNVLDPGLIPAAPVSWAVTVEGKMDNYPTEFSWRMLDPNGVEIAQGGNSTIVNENANCSGTTPAAGAGSYAAAATFAQDVQLTEMGCYTIEAFDSYGDGLLSPGYFRVRNSNSQVVINVQYACESSSTMVNDAVGVSEAANTVGVELYPNPTNGNVNMVFNTVESKVNVDVFNVLGERIMSRTLNSNGVQTIDMGGMNNGLYYFNITVGDNSTTRKVTLNR